MNRRRELPFVLLAFALGCGGRSGLDVFGSLPALGGDDATVGGGPDAGSSSSGGSASSSSGSAGSSGSSGSNGGSSASGAGSNSSGSSSGSSASSGCGSDGIDSGSQPPSCQPGGPGMTNCGVCSESCCTSLEVTGGTFYRTYTNSGSGPTSEADPATVSSFRLDKYLVTVGRFRQFVVAWNGGAGWTPAGGSGKHTHLNAGSGLANSAGTGTYESGWLMADASNMAPTDANLSCDPGFFQTWTAAAGDNEKRPINCVTWEEAYAFCIWDGGFLPSEAEWEYAAAGGSQQRRYPWGSTDPGVTNQYAIYFCLYPNGVDPSQAPRPSGICTTVMNIPPVGIVPLGAGRWGQLDLAGEMGEWNLDLYASYVSPCTDCADATGGYYRVLRSSSFGDGPDTLLPPYRFSNSYRNSNFGFRCARTP